MAEWSIAAVLKTVDLRGSGGSNPSLSATKNRMMKIIRFFVARAPAASGEGMPEAKSLRQRRGNAQPARASTIPAIEVECTPRGKRGGNAQPRHSPNQSRTQSAPDSTPARIHCATRRELLRVAHHIPLRSIPIGISMRH